jgi:hypothetical protein
MRLASTWVETNSPNSTKMSSCFTIQLFKVVKSVFQNLLSVNQANKNDPDKQKLPNGSNTSQE